MCRAVIPLVWLAPPGWPLPADLPPVADLAPVEDGVARLAALREPVAAAGAAPLACRLARLPGVERAGWLEPDRVLVLGPPGPVPVLRRAGRAWEAVGRGVAAPPVSPGVRAVLSAARLRLGLART